MTNTGSGEGDKVRQIEEQVKVGREIGNAGGIYAVWTERD